MGMTQTMAGTAPMGAQMRLQAMPATEPAVPISLIVSNVGWRIHEVVILPLAGSAPVGQRVPRSDPRCQRPAASVRLPAAAAEVRATA